MRFEVTEATLHSHLGPWILSWEGNIYGQLFNFMEFINSIYKLISFLHNYYVLKVHLFSFRGTVNFIFCSS